MAITVLIDNENPGAKIENQFFDYQFIRVILDCNRFVLNPLVNFQKSTSVFTILCVWFWSVCE